MVGCVVGTSNWVSSHRCVAVADVSISLPEETSRFPAVVVFPSEASSVIGGNMVVVLVSAPCWSGKVASDDGVVPVASVMPDVNV